MKKYAIVLLILCPLFTLAQSVEWITKPQYDYVEIIQHNLVKVKVNGKTGIITYKGDVIVEPIYDSITNFKNNIALIVDKKCKQLIGAVYGDTKTMHLVDGYEIDNEFPYFSYGLLAVRNESGKWGFLNMDLEECKGYLSCKNESVLPFSEELSFIKINSQDHAYFDVNGKPLIGDFNKMVEGYSFSNGVALAFLNNLSWALIDKKGGVKRNIKAPKQKILPVKNNRTITHSGNIFEFDAQWRLIKSTIDNEIEEYQNIIELDRTNVVSNGKLSICDKKILYDNEEIVPMQFDDIVVLNEEYVAVLNNGKYGVLHVVHNQGFSMDELAKDVVFYHALKEKVSYNITKPYHLKDKNIEIILKDSNRNNVAFETIQNDDVININFYVEPTDNKLNNKSSEKYCIIVLSDGIKYMEKTFVINKLQKKGFAISCKNNTIHSDSLGYAHCVIAIRNNTKIKSNNTEVTISYDENKETMVKIFKPGECINVPIRIDAFMSDDYVSKDISIRVSEYDYPTLYSKETLTIYRYIPQNN